MKGLSNHKVRSTISALPLVLAKNWFVEYRIFGYCSARIRKRRWWRWTTLEDVGKCSSCQACCLPAFPHANVRLYQLRRIRAASNNGFRELPPVSMGSSVDEFFVDLEDHSAEGKTLPNWYVVV